MHRMTSGVSAFQRHYQQLNTHIIRIGSTLPSLFKNFLFDLMSQNAIEAKDRADVQRKEYQAQEINFLNDKNTYENAQKRCNELQTQIMHYQARIHTLTKEEDELFMKIRDQYRDAAEEFRKSFNNVTKSQLDLDVTRESLEAQRETYYTAENRSNQAHKTLNKYFAIINTLAMILW